MEQFTDRKMIPGLNFTAIDFETANRHRRSACSLGLAVVRNGEIVETKYWLIRPEPFEVDFYNQKIHGISIDMLKGQATLAELWPEIRSYLIDEIIVAHNASFDLDVLSKSLNHYGLNFYPENHYCTYQACESMFNGNRSAKLNDVALYFDIELDHHHALSDAVVAAKIAIKLLSGKFEKNIPIERNSATLINRSYKYNENDKSSYTHFCSLSQLEKDLNTLYGFIIGIDADNKITEDEMESLKNWTVSVKNREDRHPYRVIIEKINEIVSDGIVTSDETEDLIWLCQQYLNSKNPYYNIITSSIQKLSGFLTGIAADRVISIDELEILDFWITENKFLSGTWPFDQVINILEKTATDGIIGNSVHDELLRLCDSINAIPFSENTSTKKLVETIQTTEVEIKIQESSFCFTGESKLYTRSQLADTIELYGGFVQNSVSGKLHYLVVCDEKNSCWAFASYGRKVEKAIQLKAKGKGPNVIYEEDLFAILKGLGFTH